LPVAASRPLRTSWFTVGTGVLRSPGSSFTQRKVGRTFVRPEPRAIIATKSGPPAAAHDDFVATGGATELCKRAPAKPPPARRSAAPYSAREDVNPENLTTVRSAAHDPRTASPDASCRHDHMGRGRSCHRLRRDCTRPGGAGRRAPPPLTHRAATRPRGHPHAARVGRALRADAPRPLRGARAGAQRPAAEPRDDEPRLNHRPGRLGGAGAGRGPRASGRRRRGPHGFAL
jgi:hypothetical protein